jgi:hypothetical protein
MTGPKTLYRPLTEALGLTAPGNPDAAIRAFFAPDAAIHVVHPINLCTGPDALIARLIAPLRAAFAGLHRRTDLVMGGTYEGADWVASTGYFAGTFERDWLGIRANDRLAYLRFGEFHRIEGGRAVESHVFLDLPELMIAAGQYPLPLPPGYTGLLPGPILPDGLMWDGSDPAESQRSYAIVTAMLAKLATRDEAWRPYWHPNMLWYGPAAFGSYLGIDRFAGFQVPFEQSFEGWGGGSLGNGRTRHFTRFGDGRYTCSGGWPSLSGVSVRPFLGAQPTGRMTFFRVCDFWRRTGDLLTENWVFVDIPDAMLQFGIDLFAGVEVPR